MGLLECVTALAGAKKGLYASGAGMGEGTASAAGSRARRARSFIVTYRLFGGIRSKEGGSWSTSDFDPGKNVWEECKSINDDTGVNECVNRVTTTTTTSIHPPLSHLYRSPRQYQKSKSKAKKAKKSSLRPYSATSLKPHL
jgi:hypothetical protein